MTIQQRSQNSSGFISLRRRTIFVVTVTLLAMMGLLVAFSQTIVKGGFESVENRDATLNVSRIRDAFAMQVENVDVKIIDWSMWDDAYKYMKDGNPEFEKSSLAIAALLGMKFELFAWRLPDGKIRWAREFDLEKGKDNPLSPEIAAFFDKNPSLFEFKDETDRKSGLLNIPTLGPTFFAVQPIVTSEGKGPIAGALIAGRAINTPMLDRIKKLTHLELEMRTPAQASEDKDFSPFLSRLNSPTDSVVFPLNEQTIAGFGFFNDYFEQPIAYIRMTTPRDIHAQGKTTILSFFFALGIAGLGFGLVIVFMLEKSVISRVTKLAHALVNIRRDSNLSLRVPVSGKDEISDLSTETNEMLASIEIGQKAIAARNDDMKLILDNAEQGFLNVTLDGTIVGERSAVIDRWLGKPSNSLKIWSYLHSGSQKKANHFRLGWDQLVEDFLPFEVTADQMPRRIEIDAETFEINLRPVLREGKLSSILVVVSNISEAVKAEVKEREQREAMKVVQLMLADRNSVIEFFEETKKGVATVVKENKTMSPALLMRLVHTLKGNAAQQGVDTFSKVCHDLESKLMNGETSLSSEDVKVLAQTWQVVEQRFSPLFLERERGRVEISQKDLDAALNLTTNRKPYEAISQTILSWQLEPIAQRFTRLGRIAESLGERLGKPGIKISYDDGGIRLDGEVLKEFWAGMIHVIRNAVDHGIESADERESLKKSSSGQISFVAVADGNAVTIDVSDDGKGINWDVLRKQAAKRKLKTETREDLVDALFADGVSTKEEVTEVSGRGVGMAAVRQAVKALGGTIKVISEHNKGTTFRFVLPRASVRFTSPNRLKEVADAA